MPYLPSSARNKSEYYRKLLDADVIEQNNLIKDLELKQNVSGSIDALNPTRDDDGYVVSIEDPRNPGQTAETINESVRIENKQQFFNDRYLSQVSKPFSFFTTPSSFPLLSNCPYPVYMPFGILLKVFLTSFSPWSYISKTDA